VYINKTGLLDKLGNLVAYLMGLHKYKCGKNPIWSIIYNINHEEIVVRHELRDLYDYTCDPSVTIPVEAQDAYDAYAQSKRWREEGFFDEEGNMLNNHFITFNSVMEKSPEGCGEPGKCAHLCSCVCDMYLCECV
jgi:hypothetical protein